MITKEYFNKTPMFGTGGTDMMGEWNWSGNYYIYLYRNDNLNHNYYIEYWRRGSIRKTKGWLASVRMSLTASNSGDITVAKRIKERSLKKCKEKIFDIIRYNENFTGNELINEWKDKFRTPVFVMEDSEPMIVSHTYGYLTQDFEDKGHFSYWKDQDYEYKCSVNYYTINTFRDKLSLSRNDKMWCGYSSGSTDYNVEEQKEIINKVFDQIKCNPKYGSFVSKIKELL